MGDWRYIFDLFRRHSPGYLELYQENCRFYLDEYPEQLDIPFRRYLDTPIGNDGEIIDLSETRRKYKQRSKINGKYI